MISINVTKFSWDIINCSKITNPRVLGKKYHFKRIHCTNYGIYVIKNNEIKNSSKSPKITLCQIQDAKLFS